MSEQPMKDAAEQYANTKRFVGELNAAVKEANAKLRAAVELLGEAEESLIQFSDFDKNNGRRLVEITGGRVVTMHDLGDAGVKIYVDTIEGMPA